MEEQVILVDEHDQQIGTMEKLEAHLTGNLHRAFSVFIFNSNKELLLQQRALHKYHSAGLWANTCCSHPKPGEETIDAANRRLQEEMGMKCSLSYGFSFTYKEEFSNQLTEHEFDHVYFGTTDELPLPNPDEVANFKYCSLEALEEDLQKNPDQYSAWLKICFQRMVEYKQQYYVSLDH